jgi:RND family efflux transporter MFP subunit
MEKTDSQRSVSASEPGQGTNGNGSGAHAGAHEDQIDLNVPKPHVVWVLLAGIGAVAILAVLLTIGLLPRQKQTRELDADAVLAAEAPVAVNVVRPKRGTEVMNVILPGNLRPWQEVSLFARTTGYLKKFYVDISEDVAANQLMAEIDTPEVDQQLNQAIAAVNQTNAAVHKAITDRDLAKATYDRYIPLRTSGSIAQEDLDEKKSAFESAEADVESAKANVTAAEANVQRLRQLVNFEKITAPFAGVVTGRSFDVGALILADPTTVDVKPMFKIAENDVLRAFINVPQSNSLQIKMGMDVTVTARERPGRTFTGKVLGTTNYLDPANRSLLTEVKIINSRDADRVWALLPGMYVQVIFEVKRDKPPLVVPAPALVNNAQGTQLAIVKDGKVHFEKVVLGEDFGSEVEIVSGLNGDEQVISNPGERVAEGAAVVTDTGQAIPADAVPTTAPTRVSSVR